MTTAAIQLPTFQRQTKLRVIEPKSTSQLEALSDLSDNLMYYGPWGNGKTFILAAKCMLMSKIANNRCALIRRKRTHLKATTWDVLLKDILPSSWISYYNSTELLIKLYNGSEIRGFGLDTGHDINNLASQQFGWIGVEESREVTEKQYDEQIGRSNRWPYIDPKFLQIMNVTNPDRPEHFLNVRFNTERWEGYKSIKGKILRKLLPAAYLRRVDQLRGVFRMRYKDGLWMGAEGMVYPWDPSHHLIKRFTIPQDWRRVVAGDWGFDNPFVCKWYAISPEAHEDYPAGSWFMYREMYHTHRTVNVHAPQVKKYNDMDDINPRVIMDHDPNNEAIFKEHKIKTRQAKKERLGGQNTLDDLFQADQFFYFDDALVEKDDRLVENHKPWCSAQEFPGYVWLDGKDDMSKDDDHGMDTDRYAAHTTKKKTRKGRASTL